MHQSASESISTFKIFWGGPSEPPFLGGGYKNFCCTMSARHEKVQRTLVQHGLCLLSIQLTVMGKGRPDPSQTEAGASNTCLSMSKLPPCQSGGYNVFEMLFPSNKIS